MALGDDYNNLADEDGIVQASPLFPGGTAQFMVNLTNSIGGVLDGWIDWDQNGTWDLPAETVFAGQGVPGGVQSVFAIPVPASAVPGPTFGRFRLSSTGVAGPTGFAPDGEVEDYELIVEMESEKWWQSPDLTNTGIDVNCTEPFILADDFLCEEPGRLTEFMVWASWEDDYLPFETDAYAVDFTLSIHEDVPADTAAGIDYSRPGEVLWVYNVPAGDFSAGIWLDMISEGWMDPPEDWRFPGDTECWLYTFSIPPGEAFHQVGMPDSAIVYWLDIQARPHDPQAFWGWKTSIDHWNDDAVWGTGAEPYAGPWGELVYPPLHDLAGQSIDLAFALGMWYGTEVPDGTEPRAFGLRQNTPNPFNPKTTIRYEVPAGGGHVEVQIIDVAGRLVRAYANEHESGGVKSLEWDGRDSEGRQVATGVYFYRLVARGIDESRKMLLLK